MATINSKVFPNKAKKLFLLLTDCILSTNNVGQYVSNFIDSFHPAESYIELEKVPVESTMEVVHEKMKNLREKLQSCYSAIDKLSEDADDEILRFHSLYIDVLHNLENVIDDNETTFRYISQMIIIGRKNESVNSISLKWNKGQSTRAERKMKFEKALALLDSEFGNFRE